MQEFWVYLFVQDNYIKCARLTVAENYYELKYVEDYLENKYFISIDPQNLPPYTKKFRSQDLFGSIRDTAPDYWGRELLKRKFNASDLNELEFVFANNLEHVGSLAFSPIDYDFPMKLTPQGWKPHSTDNVQIEKIIEQTELLIKDERVEKLKELFEFGPTLGGGKPKVSLRLDGQMYLAKYGTSLDSLPEQKIEFATMKMAKDLGLNVPDIKLAKHLDRDVFLIRRFDRNIQNERIGRKHFISALSLCSWHEFGTNEWSYPVFCDFLRKNGEKEKEIKEDLKDLFKRVAFNIAVNNNDDHPRNHGLLHDNGKWRLSPLYDVVPKAMRSETFTMAMTIGLYGKEASKKNLLSSARYFNLKEKEASLIVDEINQFVSNNWKKYFRDVGINEDIISQFENAMKIKL